MKYKKPRPAIIYWRDAWHNSDRESKMEDMLKTGQKKCMRQNFGLVIERTKDHIVFVDGIIDYEDYSVLSGQWNIPMAMVEKVKYLVEK